MNAQQKEFFIKMHLTCFLPSERGGFTLSMGATCVAFFFRPQISYTGSTSQKAPQGFVRRGIVEVHLKRKLRAKQTTYEATANSYIHRFNCVFSACLLLLLLLVFFLFGVNNQFVGLIYHLRNLVKIG